jgi:predicted nuclease of predicted toxin-antitoxin system
MTRFAADENFRSSIVRGLRQRIPGIDIVRIQDTKLYGAEDPVILEWTAQEGRVLLTHDIRTMPRYARDRIRAGKPMPGVILIRTDHPIGPVLEDLVLLILAGVPEDLEGQVKYLPL